MADPTGIMTKKTPLAPLQEELGARFVDFGGWDLPVLYTSIVDEVEAVRTRCGIFDVSHMGRFFVSGEESTNRLDRIVTRDLTTLKPGKQRYSLLLQEDGGILDDLMVARLSEQEFLVVANASNLESDREWIRDHLGGNVSLTDRSPDSLMLAIQGPQAEEVFRTATGCDMSDMSFLDVREEVFRKSPSLPAAVDIREPTASRSSFP